MRVWLWCSFGSELRKNGIVSQLTRVLVGLYEEPERPANVWPPECGNESDVQRIALRPLTTSKSTLEPQQVLTVCLQSAVRAASLFQVLMWRSSGRTTTNSDGRMRSWKPRPICRSADLPICRSADLPICRSANAELLLCLVERIAQVASLTQQLKELQTEQEEQEG